MSLAYYLVLKNHVVYKNGVIQTFDLYEIILLAKSMKYLQPLGCQPHKQASCK